MVRETSITECIKPEFILPSVIFPATNPPKMASNIAAQKRIDL
jgi:hypothetical protein